MGRVDQAPPEAPDQAQGLERTRGLGQDPQDRWAHATSVPGLARRPGSRQVGRKRWASLLGQYHHPGQTFGTSCKLARVMSGHRIAFRYLLAREQLAPALHHLEQLVRQEDWRGAREALFAFGKTLGVFFTGSGYRVSTEWFSALDPADQHRFLEFLKPLVNIWEVVFPRASGQHARPFEQMWMDRQFDNLREDLPWVQDAMRDESDAFKHGNFLIIPTKGVHDTSEAVKVLDEVSKHISPKFPHVLYGKVYVRKDLRPKGSFDARPGQGGMIAGAYQATTDTVTLSMYATPDRNSTLTLIHEFGHRYHTRFLKGDKREKFMQLSTVGDVQEDFFPLAERHKFAEEYVARLTGFRDDENFGDGGPVHLSERADKFFAGYPRDEFRSKVLPLKHKFDEGDNSVVPTLKEALARSQFGGNLRVVQNEENLSPVYASLYGETSWEENFAESFLAFCTGKVLPKSLQTFMESL